MKHASMLITVGIVLLWIATSLPDGSGQARSTAMTGPEVLRELDEAMFPGSLVMDMTLVDHPPKGRGRSFRIHVQATKRIGSIVALLSPPTEVGKNYLFKDRNVWISIPGLPNAIRVSSKEAFMDSTFANNDLMDTEYSDDYEVGIEKTVENDGVRHYVLRCAAKSPRVTYHSIRMMVESETYIPLQFDYFARSGMLLKTCVFSERKHLAGRLRASRIEMRDASVDNDFTVITIESMKEAKLAPGIFSVESIRK